MTQVPKVVVAIHQLPWEISVLSECPLNFTIKKRQESFGLYSGLHSLTQFRDVMFVGTLAPLPPSLPEDALEKIQQELRQPPYNSIPIFVSEAMLQGHDVYSSQILRPLLHYVISNAILAKTDEEYANWDSFVELNTVFANTIASVVAPNDLIWVIDYRLILLPNILHNMKNDLIVGYFHYAPFPSSEIIRCLPQRKEIISGLLGATLVGFQHYSYASHFLSCCTRILGLETFPTGVNNDGHTASVGIFPTGVKVGEIETLRDSDAVREAAKTLRESFPTKKIIIGYEHESQLNGVWHKICSFEKFIENHPEVAKNTILIQIMASSEKTEALKYEDKIYELVSKINAKYGSIDHLPIQYFTHPFERVNLLAALSEADACVITSERDSANDLAFEYVLCQKHKKSPLIISELVGNAANFTTALHVNPWDYRGVADNIFKALTMSEKEKGYRFDQLYKKVITCNINDWGDIFISELEELSKSRDSNETIPLDPSLIFSEYSKSQRRLFMLDYDGTLADIQSIPSAAAPTQKALDILVKLTKNPRNHVFIISGRDQNTLDEWLGHIPNLGFSAEHGCFSKLPGDVWVSELETMDISWKEDVLSVFEYYTERTPGSFIEHKRSSITWHYRLSDPDYGSWQANECLTHLESFVIKNGDLEIVPGKKNLEVRPKLINKGEVVARLCQHYSDVEFIVCIGDDKTDEDMFKSLKKIGKHSLDSTFSCMVGSNLETTHAKYFIRTPGEVLNLLQVLADSSD